MLLNIVEKGGGEDGNGAMMINDEKYEPIVELVIEDRDELQEKLQEQVKTRDSEFGASDLGIGAATRKVGPQLENQSRSSFQSSAKIESSKCGKY